MKTKFKALIVVMLCMVLGCILLVGCNDNDEDQVVEIKPAKTIEVSNADELIAATQYVGLEYSQYTIKLTSDIDLSEKEWTPIGATLSKAFRGTFDGNGKTISGLKITGWESDGTPVYVAKEIVGWLNDGTPVYRSSEIIQKTTGSVVDGNDLEVTDYIGEGDNDDPNYVLIEDGEGTFEKEASYGSVGLFGYTYGATIKNLVLDGADLSFYATGKYTYAGTVSGYDVGSEFSNVTVNNSTIAVSLIYDQKIKYEDNYGTPSSFIHSNENVQYVGGIVGYVQSNTTVKDGQATITPTSLQNVVSNNFYYDNVNYCAYYDAGFDIYQGKNAGDNKLVVQEGAQGAYNVSKINTSFNILSEYYPAYVYSGAVAGYANGANINVANVDGFNLANNANEGTNKLVNITEIMGRSVYMAGVVGGLYNSVATEVSANNVFVNGIHWSGWDNNTYRGLIYDKTTVGGAFGITVKSTISEGDVTNLYVEVGGTSLEEVCLGGFIGYADDYTNVSTISVDGVYQYSTFAGSVEGSSVRASIMAGAVGVLRDSSLTGVSVNNVSFEVSGNKADSYSFARGIVSQTYSNSKLDNANANDVYTHTSRTTKEESDKVYPAVVVKNNYVNEDGYTSARLYYTVDGKYDATYVIVNGQLISKDANNNILIEDYVYKKVTLSGYSEGDNIQENKYYVYDEGRDDYIFIGENTASTHKKYSSSKIYAEKISVLRVEFANSDVELTANTYYEYTKSTGVFEYTTDNKAKQDKAYYVYNTDENVAGYYLDITVYSESGKTIVVEQNDVDNDDDDVLAKARYELTKEEVANSDKTVQCGDTVYALASAEIYVGTYFTEGIGFKADVNGFTIKYYDNTVQNRDFSKYVLITGRPVIDNVTITYGVAD